MTKQQTKTTFKQTKIGMMPEEWEVKELKDILQKKGYIRGPFGSALRRPELKKQGIPVYEQANVIYNYRQFRFFIDEKKFEEFIKEDIIKRQTPDKSRAEFLIKESENAYKN